MSGIPQDRLARILEFLNKNPGDPFLLFAAAKEYESRGNTSEARTYYHRIHDVQPEYVALYYHYGKLEESCGNMLTAERIYLEGIEISLASGDHHANAELKAALDNLHGM